jgi:methylsterol monooxygenase
MDTVREITRAFTAPSKYERGPIKHLLSSSFGFTLAIILGGFTLDYAMNNNAQLGVVGESIRAAIVGTWAYVYDLAKENLADGDATRAGYLLVVYGTQIFHISTFWAQCLVLTCFDLWPTNPLWSWTQAWRIQAPDVPVDRMKMFKTAMVCLFNQLCINIPLGFLVWPLYEWKGMTFEPEALPTFNTFLRHMCVIAAVEEIGFYYGHRLMHVPFFYKRFHKQHHEWTAPVGWVAIYADPLEHVVSNLLPVMMGPWICSSHVVVYWFWLWLAVFVTVQVHSGYHFPFLPSPEFHDFHHLKFNVNYGVLGFLDWLHATDGMFYMEEKWKFLSDRDRVFFSTGPKKEMTKAMGSKATKAMAAAMGSGKKTM